MHSYYSTTYGQPAAPVLPDSHPFTQQIDILFSPENHTLEERLRGIDFSYYTAHVELSDLLNASYDLTGKFSTTHNDLLALSVGRLGAEDVWCIDQRGLLTLALTKETYQQLGLVGQSQTKKSDIHYVQVDLHDKTSSLFTRAKERVRLWDERRKAQGIPPWRVYLQGSALPTLHPNLRLELVKVQPRCTTQRDILVPVFDASKREFTFSDARGRPAKEDLGEIDEEEEEEEEDRKEHLDSLFEWVGLAGIGSERLKANDSPNPFVARYEAPYPNIPGTTTHLRWTGFLGPGVVRRLLEAALSSESESESDSIIASTDAGGQERKRAAFIAVTANLFRDAPLTYISRKAFEEGAEREVRMGMGRKGRCVGCWSLIVKPCGLNGNESGGGETEMEWVLASVESTG